MTRTLRIEWRPGDKVTGHLAMPKDAGGLGVLLAHGAGAGQDHPFMVEVRDGLAAAGYPVLTFNYPYTEAGRRGPDPAARLLAAHAAAADRLGEYVDSVVLAGKSMGGRIGSHLAAQGAEAAGMVYYGYPLVAIGKTEPRDTEHLSSIAAPQLFFCGTRDKLCPLDLLTVVVAGLDGAEVAVIEDGDHSFRVPKRTGSTDEQIRAGLVQITVDWLAEL